MAAHPLTALDCSYPGVGRRAFLGFSTGALGLDRRSGNANARQARSNITRCRRVALDWVGIEEMLRRLHDADCLFPEQAERARNETGERDEVGVQDGNEIGWRGERRKISNRVVDVAGLGVRVVGSGKIVTALLRAKLRQPVSSPVIENPDPEIRVLHALRPNNGALQNGPILIVGADQNVNERARLQ